MKIDLSLLTRNPRNLVIFAAGIFLLSDAIMKSVKIYKAKPYIHVEPVGTSALQREGIL
jgi:hypothetical protein